MTPGGGAFRVLYATPMPAELRAIAEAALPHGFELEGVASADRADLLATAGSADFLLVAGAAVDEELLREAPRLRLIQLQGVGYDNIDLEACRRAGVPVALCPEGTIVGVAEHTILLILALYKRLLEANAAVRAGGWPVWELRARSFELAGKTLGIVGFGRIGCEVARRAAAFDARIVYADPVPAPPKVEAALAAARLPLRKLLEGADVVSLHAPLEAGTRHLVGERELALMKREAILVNTARGGLVDERALAAALTEGRIAGAALDVLEREPPARDDPLLSLPNVVLTPHIAAGTRDAFEAKMRSAFANMARVARGEPPLHAI